MKLREGERFICKCDCGGNVIGTTDFGLLFTVCDRCSPIVRIDLATISRVELKTLSARPGDHGREAKTARPPRD